MTSSILHHNPFDLLPFLAGSHPWCHGKRCFGHLRIMQDLCHSKRYSAAFVLTFEHVNVRKQIDSQKRIDQGCVAVFGDVVLDIALAEVVLTLVLAEKLMDEFDGRL